MIDARPDDYGLQEQVGMANLSAGSPRLSIKRGVDETYL